MLLLATSPGGRGGATVLEIAKGRFPHMGGNIIADFSLPSFGQNFLDDTIVNSQLRSNLEEAIKKLEQAI
jgi:chromate reductase, NAD(P)H dehydrogenase (quinone)